ncbi:MAG TPA: CPXCG motif-containing cysteine-rich protein [Woeseiaceae bacterium]
MDPAPVIERVRCPYCGERIEIVVDLSAGGQSYVEDCAVCCQPIEISFDVADGELESVRVDRAG